jgi:deoxyribodipyrimidine photolyase-related protein
MCEDYGLCSYIKHHKLKLLHVLSAMRFYRDELLSLGLKVNYKSIEEENFREDYLLKLKKIIVEKKYKQIYFFEIEDKFFEKVIFNLREFVQVEILKSPMFLFSREEFNNTLNKNKKPIMANIYKFSRRK